MENLIENGVVQLLEDNDVVEIGGGKGFAYDVGRVFRYLGMAAIYGIPAAMFDAAANDAACSC